MADIFICYRRDDTQAFAGRIFDRIAHHFGDGTTFLDVEGRKGGEFLKRLEQEASSCKVMVVLIGKQWLTLTDKSGRRRLDKKDDVVRRECQIGLGNGALMIPVTVDGAPVLGKDDLPEDIARLAAFDAVEIRHTRFRDDVEELLEIIGHKIPPLEQRQKPPDPPPVPSAPPAFPLLKIFPGSWQMHIVYPNGVIGSAVAQILPGGAFQAQGGTPFVQFRLWGNWRVDSANQVSLTGQQTNGFQTLPYFATLFFAQISQQSLAGTSSGGERTTWQRLS